MSQENLELRRRKRLSSPPPPRDPALDTRPVGEEAEPNGVRREAGSPCPSIRLGPLPPSPPRGR